MLEKKLHFERNILSKISQTWYVSAFQMKYINLYSYILLIIFFNDFIERENQPNKSP